ncbi:uncharacterized protein BO97DRAFT_470025 [Aspergillus homomorphus CBS 101889]|uniref:Alcohol dehydrogenase-like C-terminal domain-containing protein n=1 Tax=Aspergillus homomorphus (strain CBS 101889) TaxID=1450537 RepID=A0A395HYW8_ASPHC|nr:hypothetical protein BO97DRAFT_470025 [Aspergillus homomorphus CBS 101889]RAL12887.1 hypothetical protein BO97DRAFT_470025 [Aspergillus homomorphus CBS 101889]
MESTSSMKEVARIVGTEKRRGRRVVARVKKSSTPHAQLELRHAILPVPEPGNGEVLVKLECTGFCHSVLRCIHGELPLSINVVGHEGVREEYVVSPADFVSLIPENLAPEAVALLLCAGLTMYGALNKLDKYCDKGDWVVIMGAGGGLGHLGIQVGKEMGYRVIAVDSESKRDICMRSGAEAFVDFPRQPLTDGIGAHAVIVVVGLKKACEQSVNFLRPVGTLVCVGLPRPDYHLRVSPLMCVDRGYRIVGSAVGTGEEMQALLKLAADGKLSTHVRVSGFEQINEVAGLLERFEVEGRAVLRMP